MTTDGSDKKLGLIFIADSHPPQAAPAYDKQATFYFNYGPIESFTPPVIILLGNLHVDNVNLPDEKRHSTDLRRHSLISGSCGVRFILRRGREGGERGGAVEPLVYCRL